MKPDGDKRKRLVIFLQIVAGLLLLLFSQAVSDALRTPGVIPEGSGGETLALLAAVLGVLFLFNALRMWRKL